MRIRCYNNIVTISIFGKFKFISLIVSVLSIFYHFTTSLKCSPSNIATIESSESITLCNSAPSIGSRFPLTVHSGYGLLPPLTKMRANYVLSDQLHVVHSWSYKHLLLIKNINILSKILVINFKYSINISGYILSLQSLSYYYHA